jgi:hypothetical protein
VRLSPLGTAAITGLLYQPRMIGDGDCGAIGGMKIGRGNRSTRRKPAPAPLLPQQITHDLPGHRNGKPATNRLSYGATYIRFTVENEMSTPREMQVGVPQAVQQVRVYK